MYALIGYAETLPYPQPALPDAALKCEKGMYEPPETRPGKEKGKRRH